MNVNKQEAYAIVRDTGLRNPFRDHTMRNEWDACIFMHQTKHRNFFINGERRRSGSYGSSLASSFWQGYDNINSHQWDRASKSLLAYAHWRAGRDIAKQEEKNV